jgi:hypothetical protein
MKKIISPLLISGLALGLGGCSNTPQVEPDDSSRLQEIYHEAKAMGRQQTLSQMSETFEMKQGYATQRNVYPVIVPSQVARVWIPSIENNRDDALITGHEVFLRVYRDEWGIGHEQPTSSHHLDNLRLVELPEVENESHVVSSSSIRKGKSKSAYSVPVSEDSTSRQ